MDKTLCWDSPCSYGKPICCLDCDKKVCFERCDQFDCETWKEKEKSDGEKED